MYNQGYPNQGGGFGGGGAQLPVDPRNQVTPMANVSVGQPPFVPQVQVPPQIQPYVPLIASLVILEIQNNMAKNPLRMFMFNWYARDHYNNYEFHEVVEIVAKYCHLQLMTRGGDPAQLIGNVVPDIVKMLAAGAVKLFPPIQQFLQEQDFQIACQNVQKLERLIAGIAQAEGRSGYAAAPGGFQNNNSGFSGGGGGFGGGAGAGYSMNGGGGYGGGAANQRPTSLTTTGLFSSGATVSTGFGGALNNGVNDSGNAGSLSNMEKQLQRMRNGGKDPVESHPLQHTSQISTTRQEDGSSVLSSMNNRIHARKEEATRPVYSQEVDPLASAVGMLTGSQENVRQKHSGDSSLNAGDDVECNGEYVALQEPGSVRWTRSHVQAHHPAWNSLKQKLFYVKLKTGAVVAIVVDKTEEELKTMEYDKHAIGGSVPVIAQPAPSTGDDANQQVLHKEFKLPDISLVEREETSMDGSDKAACFYSGLEARVSGKLVDKSSAYHVDGLITHPLYCTDAEQAAVYRETLTEIMNAGSLTKAQEILKRVSVKEDMRTLFLYVNNVLTQEVNNAVRVNMSMNGVSIDSFFDDFSALLIALRKKYGDAIVDSLLNAGGKLLAQCIRTLDKEEADSYTRDMASDITGFSDWKGEVVYNIQRVSYTHLGAASHDLKVAVVPGQASLVDIANTPEMFDIAKKVLNTKSAQSYHFYRHHIVTSDGVVINVTRGFLNKEAMIIHIDN